MTPPTIQYCSDLHLEFDLNAKFIKKYPLQVKGDILLLAGDIVPFAVMDKHKDFFSFVSDNFKHTYWVPGNHEYYNSDITEKSGTLNEKIRENVHLVNNVVIEHGGVEFICSTLWSKIDPGYEWQIERAMSDFHLIRYKGFRYSIPVFNQMHEESMNFVKTAIAAGGANKKVVVTHHIPTFLNYPQQFKGDILSQAFAVELYPFIEHSDIHSWIYGHHHCNTPDFKIGNTTLLTNQLGYVKYGEHTSFNAGKTVLI